MTDRIRPRWNSRRRVNFARWRLPWNAFRKARGGRLAFLLFLLGFFVEIDLLEVVLARQVVGFDFK